MRVGPVRVMEAGVVALPCVTEVSIMLSVIETHDSEL